METTTLAFLAWLALNALLTFIRLPFSAMKGERLTFLAMSVILGAVIWACVEPLQMLPRLSVNPSTLSLSDPLFAVLAVLQVWWITAFWLLYIICVAFTSLVYLYSLRLSWLAGDSTVQNRIPQEKRNEQKLQTA